MIRDGSRLDVSRWFQNASEEVPDLARSIGGIQRPLTAAPSGRTFPIGLLTAEDRRNIPAAKVRSLLLRAEASDSDQNDPLHLESMLREQLRGQSRGAGSTESGRCPRIIWTTPMKTRPGLSGQRCSIALRAGW